MNCIFCVYEGVPVIVVLFNVGALFLNEDICAYTTFINVPGV